MRTLIVLWYRCLVMARSKKFLLLAISPLGLGLGACSPEMSDGVSSRAGETTEASSLYDGVGDVPTAKPTGGDKSTTTLISNNELSPIKPINPGKFGTCGDGTLTTFTGEECDDGNTVNGDGCSKQCKLENTGGGKIPGKGSLQPIKPIKPIQPIQPGTGIPPKFPGTDPGKLPIPWPPGGGNPNTDPWEAACYTDLPADPNTNDFNFPDQEPLFNSDSYIGVLPDDCAGLAVQQCTCVGFSNAEWDVTELFPDIKVAQVRPDVLQGYCISRPVVPGVAPIENHVVGLLDFGNDRPVVGGQSADPIGVNLKPILSNAYAKNAGGIAGVEGILLNYSKDLGYATSGEIRVSILDTAPFEWPGAGLGQVAEDLRSVHSPGIEGLFTNLICDGFGGTCNTRITTEIAMPLSRTGDAFPSHLESDNVRGGSFGTFSDAAQAVDDATRRFRNDALAAAPTADRLVLNMSFGWDEMWGGSEFNGFTFADQLGLLQDRTNNTGVPASVRAVHAAMVAASCEGALMFAASGNGSMWTCNETSMYPAAWEVLERPTIDECIKAENGLVDLSSTTATDFGHPVGPLLDATSEGAPLVHAVGAVDHAFVPGTMGDPDTVEYTVLGMQRDKALPRLSGLGYHGVAVDALGSEYTAIQSGTSIGTATVAAAMTAAWTVAPTLAPHEVVNAVYNKAEPLLDLDAGTPLEVDLELDASAKSDARRVTLCGAVQAVYDAVGNGSGYQVPCAPDLTKTEYEAIAAAYAATAAAAAGGSVTLDDVNLPGLAINPPASTPSGQITCDGPTTAADPYNVPDGCGGAYIFTDATGPGAPNNPGPSPNPYILPQPKSDSCPACEIVEGGGEIHLYTSRDLESEAPHHVIVSRYNSKKNSPIRPMVIDLGSLTLSNSSVTTIVDNTAFGPDPDRSKAEVTIEVTDESGNVTSYTESIEVVTPGGGGSGGGPGNGGGPP